MAAPALSPEMAAGELYRRRRARRNLIEYARAIEIPGAPVRAYDDSDEAAYLDEVVFAPIESVVVIHHRVMLAAIQETIERDDGRLIIQAPPGSAKSSYASVVATSWAMGRFPGISCILASYALPIARKHSRRAQQICRTADFSALWPERPTLAKGVKAAHEWHLTNGSEFFANGILAGITGYRADVIVADDLIAGREEAESATIREKTMEEYRDSLETRLKPGGSVVVINTRWHQEDPCGQLLPADYDGESGYMTGQDGREWLVINLPAKAENHDDPIGREVGEYLWPEWFGARHWQQFENDPRGRRRWASLYQQRPTADEGEDFQRSWFHFYEPDELPQQLTFYGASDFAVEEVDPEDQKQGRIDYTEHGVVGIDDTGDLWFVDWWSGQTATDTSVTKMLELAQQWGCRRWWDEGGTIDKAIRPLARRLMKELSNTRRGNHYIRLESIPRIADKRAKCQSFQGRAAARTVHFPAGVTWANEVVAQLTGFPGHRYDDKYDVCGLIGRGIDQMMDARPARDRGRKRIKPFTAEWLEHDETERPRRKRYK